MGAILDPLLGQLRTTDPLNTSIYQPTNEPRPNSTDIIITNFISPHGFGLTSANGTQANDTTNYIRGSQSLKLTTNGLGNATFTQKTNISPTIDLTGKQVKLWVMVDKPTNVTQLYFYFSSDNITANWVTIKPSNDVTCLKPNVWECLTFSFSGRDAQVTGSPILTTINSIQIRVTDDATTAVNLWVNEIALYSATTSAVVSITFDDGYLSQYNLGKPILDSYEYSATAYVIPDRVINNPLSNYMQLPALHTLEDLGWDISNHTYDHPYLTTDPVSGVTLTSAQVEAEFYRSKQWLISNGFTKGIHDMALPHGAYNDTVVLPAAKKYFRSVRTIVNQSETLAPGNRFKLRTLYVINTTTVATVKSAIDKAIAGNEWLILVFHDIQTTTASQDIQYLSADFKSIIDYLYTSNATVKTVADVLNHGLPAGGGTGTVTSVSVSGGSTGLTTSGGPITGSGTISLGGTLSTGNGGTGLTSFTSGTVVTATSTSSLATTKTAPGGAFVGTSDTQTLSSKTLTTPTINGTKYTYVAKTSAYTIASTDNYIDCTSGTFTVTLPTAVGITGAEYSIKNSGVGTITLATTSSQTIDGAASYSLATQYKYVTLVSDGSNWKVWGNN